MKKIARPEVLHTWGVEAHHQEGMPDESRRVAVQGAIEAEKQRFLYITHAADTGNGPTTSLLAFVETDGLGASPGELIRIPRQGAWWVVDRLGVIRIIASDVALTWEQLDGTGKEPPPEPIKDRTA